MRDAQTPMEHGWPHGPATYVMAHGPYSYHRKVVARRVGYEPDDHQPHQDYGTWVGDWEDFEPIIFLPQEYDEQVWPRRHWQ